MSVARPYANSQPLALAEVDLDPPRANEVLISIRAAGLCHSDLSVIDGNRPRPMPMVLGHEAAGVVEELGPGVSDLRVGDHVVTTFVPSCGQCAPCAAERAALCEPGALSNSLGELIGGGCRLHLGAADLHHHLGVSAFAQYAVVSKNSVVAVDRALPFAQAALFGCAVITGVGAVVNTANIGVGSRVAVIGLGGVGLAALLGARARGAGQLIAVDISAEKLALARELGATDCVDARHPECVDEIRQLTHGGVDYAFEMAGSQKAMDVAYRSTRRGGTTVTAGLPPPTVMFSVPHVGLVADERTVKGSYLGSCNPSKDIPRYIEWFYEGRLPVQRLVSEQIPLSEINQVSISSPMRRPCDKS